MLKKIKFKKIKSPFNAFVLTKSLGPVFIDLDFMKNSVFIKIAKEFNFNINNFFLGEQVHRNKIENIDEYKSRFLKKTDGLISNKNDIILTIATADCLPIVMVDPITNYFGIFHAGHKGILNGILENALSEFKNMNSNLSDLLIGIGPGIEAKCYDVGEDRINLFKEKYFKFNDFYFKENEKYFLDLKKLSLNILTNLGINKKNIEVMNFCTKCDNNLFYSHRVKPHEGNFLTLIWKE